MAKELATFKSKSNPNHVYKVILGEDGVEYCTCWGWKKNRTCKHLEYWHSQQGILLPANPFVTTTVRSKTLQEIVAEEIAKLSKR